jgi:hypothetical protein
MPNVASLLERTVRWVRLPERIPALASSGEESAVDLILYEVLRLLVDEVKADIGHINLLPKGGRVEKVCTLKDGKPWLRKKTDLHLFDPYHGFTGEVMRSGQSILVKDIWEPGTEADPNPFLEVYATMNERYVKEIKAPLASIIMAPIKRGHDIFCTIELGRYRERDPFDPEDKELIDAFGRQYGSLVIDYILDVKNRIAVNTAHRKLLALSRLIASKHPVDYRDAVEAYMKLSAADIGFAFFKTGELRASNYRTLVWQGEEIREVLLSDFFPSSGSMLRSDTEVSFLIEGEGGDDRLLNFKKRIRDFPGVRQKDRKFIQACLNEVRSYVAYPLHLLGQDLGAIVLGSRRERFWEFLHMNPFLDLYNSLLKSFLLNERVIHYLSDVSLKIHNPGYYCLAGVKGPLALKYPDAFQDPDVSTALAGLEKLFDELHDQGKVLRVREKNIHLLRWIKAFVGQKGALLPGFEFEFHSEGESIGDCVSRAREQQLETIFENLFTNSVRAITSRQQNDPSLIGRITVRAWQDKDRIKVIFKDNGAPYPTVSGRGVVQVREEMRHLGGTVRRYRSPYRVVLSFPSVHDPTKEG